MDEDDDDDGVVDNASKNVTKEKGPNKEDEDANAEDAYQTTKAMGDLDQKVTASVSLSASVYSPSMFQRPGKQDRTKDDHTANVRTIFTREKGSVNPDNGEVEDGHWCELCKLVDLRVCLCQLDNHACAL
jgi:hypothetical protein